MTITPVPITPVAAPAGPAASSGQPAEAAAALFGLLVGQHLDAGTGLGSGPAAPAAQAPKAPGQAPAATDGTTPAPVGPCVRMPPVSGSVVSGVIRTQVPAAGAAANPAGADDTQDHTSQTPDAAAAGGLAVLVGFPVVALPVASTTATTDPAGHAEQAGPGSGSSHTVVGPETPGAAGAGAAGPADVTTPPAAATSPGALQQAAGPTAIAPGLTPVLAPAPAGASTSPSPSTASAVLDQVLPAVPRLVLRGDGTSRLTLKLHPADLGEVHLTVTVRGKEVDVTLSAGPQAREALADGSSRLRGLLEGIGHTTGQVVVRDLPSGPTASTSQQPGASTAQTGGQTSGQPHGQADARDQAFRRPAALDGDPSARGGRAGDPSLHLRSGVPRHQPSGPSGLDVTI